MTFRFKALAAALLVSFTPALAVAQAGDGDGGAANTPGQLYGCQAAQLQRLVGHDVGIVNFPGNVRIIGPTTLVTLDYLPHRMNIRHNAAGVITAVYCG